MKENYRTLRKDYWVNRIHEVYEVSILYNKLLLNEYINGNIDIIKLDDMTIKNSVLKDMDFQNITYHEIEAIVVELRSGIEAIKCYLKR